MTKTFKPLDPAEHRWSPIESYTMFYVGQLVRPAGSERVYGEQLVVVSRTMTEYGGDRYLVTYEVRPVNRSIHAPVKMHEHDLWPWEYVQPSLAMREFEKTDPMLREVDEHLRPASQAFSNAVQDEIVRAAYHDKDGNIVPHIERAQMPTVESIEKSMDEAPLPTADSNFCEHPACFGSKGHSGLHRDQNGKSFVAVTPPAPKEDDFL